MHLQDLLRGPRPGGASVPANDDVFHMPSKRTSHHLEAFQSGPAGYARSKETTMYPTANDKLQFIFGRRSVRAYAPGEIAEVEIAQLLQAAMAAPSAVAKDPWRFVVIRKKETLSAIAAALPNGGMLASAPVGIVICGDLQAAHDRQLSYLLQDCSAAIENLLLAAHILGLGACWLGIHPREDRVRKVRELLSLPPSVIPVACVSIGRPGETREPRTRFNPEYVHSETW
jgi:nitroreductase